MLPFYFKIKHPIRRILAVALLAIGTGFQLLSSDVKGQGGQSPPEVVTINTEVRSVPVVRDFVGMVEASETVELRARVEGFLSDKHFAGGKVVNKGDLLFTIDAQVYEAALGEAEAQLAKAEAQLALAQTSAEVAKARADLARSEASLANARQHLARIKPLAEADAASGQELDAAIAQDREASALVDASRALLTQAEINKKTDITLAQAGIKAAQAAVVKARLNLGYTKIISPITGIAGDGLVNVGSLVGKGENSLLAVVSDVSRIGVKFSISERDYLAWAKKQADRTTQTAQLWPLKIQLVLADDTLFGQEGAITFIDRAVDPKTGTIALKAEFPNPDSILRPGQYGKLRITAPQSGGAILIPQRAVRELQGVQSVLLVNALDVVEERGIKAGERIGNEWMINQGLNAGDRVIIEGSQKVRPGMKVHPVNALK